jgi:phosphatidate cytidylyltransferase
MDWKTSALVGGVLLLLSLASAICHFLKRQPEGGINPGLVRTFTLRIRAWWLMCSILGVAYLPVEMGKFTTVLIFGLVSFWALREFITLTPTRLGDHRSLFWVFFLFTPLQFVLVGMENYGLYSVLIPVYAFLFIPARIALAGDYQRFQERTATIQAGLMVCVYCFSYAPALLTLKLTDQSVSPARLLFFFVVIVEMSDAFSWACGKLFGRRVIAPEISPNKTWEGFLGGAACTTLLGTGLYWATPFNEWQAAGMSLIVAITGFVGGLTMSAIKRDRGVRDYSTLTEGRVGVLDRIDSLCFAAPVFFHLTRVYFTDSV